MTNATETDRDPFDNPSPAALDYLSSLDLSEEDFELLLGDVPGLSFVDVKENASALFFRLRKRLRIADDQRLRTGRGLGCRIQRWTVPGRVPRGLHPDIIAAARQAGVARGLYIGCGNGRNYLLLTAARLDLTGLDISAAAIPARRPHSRPP